MKIVYVILSICFLSPIECKAQVSEYIYTQYTARDGLSSNECYDVTQDLDGYIWVSTDNGITRFDGTDFKRYNVADGLRDQVIFKLKIDEQGHLWAGGLKGEFYIYNKISDRFEPWIHNDILAKFNTERKEIIKDFEVNLGSVTLMRYNYGVVTIKENGVVKIDSINQEKGYQIIVTNNKSYTTTHLVSNKLNFPTIFQYGDTTCFVNIPLPPSKTSSQFRTLIFKDLCIVSASGFTTGVQNDEIIWSRKENPINKFNISKDGSLIACLGNREGVRKYKNEADNQYETIVNDISATNFFEDYKGGYWITSTDKGLFYIKNTKIKYLSNMHSSGYYTDVIADRINHIYTATFDGNLGIYNLNDDYFDLVYSTDGSEFITCNYNKYDNHLYFSVETSYFKIDENGNVIDVNSLLSLEDQSIILTVKDVYFEKSHMHFIDIAKNYFIIMYDDEKYNLKDSYIYHQDNFYRGNKIIKSMSNNIYVGDSKGLQVKAPGQHQDFVMDSIFNGLRIEDIIEDQSERLILGTKGRGFIIYNPKNGEVTYIDETDGLISNYLEDIEHQEGNIYWVASLKGISRVDFSVPNNPIIDNYTMSHGLPVPDVYDLVWNDGILYAATGDGVIKILNTDLDYPSPKPRIKSVKINNDERELEKKYNLEYNENSVIIEYKTINHAQASSQKYRHKVNDEDWRITNESNILLTNLSPDDYNVEIQSENENGVWSSSSLINLNVKQPWWNTWWFYLIVFCAILGSTVYYYRQKEKRLAKKNTIEKELRSLEKAALQSQMNPHFIFNSLNSIQNFIMSNDKLAAMDYLSQFAKLIRLTLNASSEEVISLYEEVQMLNHYLSLEKLRFKSKFDFIVNVDMDLHLHDTQIPPILIQPLVENAIKHGMKDRSEGGKIGVMFARKDDKIVVTVRDNGTGFSEDDCNSLHKSMGMDITKKRLGSEDGVRVRREGEWTEVEVVV